jgi:hypothetical protein
LKPRSTSVGGAAIAANRARLVLLREVESRSRHPHGLDEQDELACNGSWDLRRADVVEVATSL